MAAAGEYEEEGRADEEESKLNTVDEGDHEGTSGQGITTDNDKGASAGTSYQQLGMSNSKSNDPTANIPIRAANQAQPPQ